MGKQTTPIVVNPDVKGWLKIVKLSLNVVAQVFSLFWKR